LYTRLSKQENLGVPELESKHIHTKQHNSNAFYLFSK
jgi:hypothetical protein